MNSISDILGKMEFKKFIAGKDDNDRRIDKIIRRFLPELSLSETYKYIRKGLIKINGKKAKQESHVFEKDEISIAEFIFSKAQNPENSNSFEVEQSTCNNDFPEIVFQNQHILLINKPYDITVHGDKTSLDKKVQKYYEMNLASKNESLSFKTGPLHRLDRKTTGLLAFSLSLEGARWFSENIKTHVIQKKYYALLQGKLKKTEHWIDSIKKDNSNIKNFHTVKATAGTSDEEDSKIAESFVTPVKYGRYKDMDVTLCEILIKTGRTHQIRSQTSLHGFPLLGDTAYGGIKLEKTEQDFYLQAFQLTFPEKNPLELPEKIEISPSVALKKILKSCYIEN